LHVKQCYGHEVLLKKAQFSLEKIRCIPLGEREEGEHKGFFSLKKKITWGMERGGFRCKSSGGLLLDSWRMSAGVLMLM